MKRDLESPAEAVKDNDEHLSDGDEDDDEDVNMIDVDFDFFDLAPIDFHALNTLLKQLMGPDAVKFELGALADLLLANKIGSSIKVDGEDSDPYAFLTVLNMDVHKEHEQLKLIKDYLLSKVRKNDKMHATLSKAGAQVGLLFSERLINMPVEVAGPLYRILGEEISARQQSGKDSDKQYNLSHYLLWSKSYTETISKLDEEDDRPRKKGKQKQTANKEVFYFHPEDEILIKHASHHTSFPYSNAAPESDSKRAFHDFGIHPVGELILLTKDQLAKAIQEIQEAFPF
jgi:protein BCP1